MSDQEQLLLDAVSALHEEKMRLPDGAMTIRDIMKKLGLPYKPARLYIRQLLKEEKIIRIRRANNKNYYIFKDGIN